MCGIVGVLNLAGGPLPEFDGQRALETIRHRGPDDVGTFQGPGVFIGARRLAIIDVENGRQPTQDESGRFHLAMNGEIYDYDVLIEELKGRGHRFRTRCDTEVAVHLFEEKWSDALEEIDGQFAIAAWDARERKLLLARDRMGISPLFYARRGDYLVFASEMKAIFATGLVQPEMRTRALDAVFSFGCVPAPGTMFEGVYALPPGHFIEAVDGDIAEHEYWDIPYGDAGDYPERSDGEWEEAFREILHRACRRRLKADVPVGVYLSGGIDSSTVALMVADAMGAKGRVFSIGFPEPGFDESSQTRRTADFLGLDTTFLTYTQDALVRDLPKLIYHAETPMTSTESIPLMALSEVAARHVKVVLTGEGSDEALGGYAYFRWEAYKETVGDGLVGKIAMALARSKFRKIFGERNPFFPEPRDAAYAQEVFGCYPAQAMSFHYYRMARDLAYTDGMLARAAGESDAEFVQLPKERMARWDQLHRSLYVSSRVFMTTHLLGPHTDRASMAHSLEGRFPYLDRQLQEFLTTVPPRIKTQPYTEKRLLRRAMTGRLPREVIKRRKLPFLAPFGTPFVGEGATEYIRDLLSESRLKEFGYFDPDKIARLVARLEVIKKDLVRDKGPHWRMDPKVSERTILGMALTAVVCSQVFADQVRSGRFDAAAAAQPVAREETI